MGNYTIKDIKTLADEAKRIYQQVVNKINKKGGSASTLDGIKYLPAAIDTLPEGLNPVYIDIYPENTDAGYYPENYGGNGFIMVHSVGYDVDPAYAILDKVIQGNLSGNTLVEWVGGTTYYSPTSANAQTIVDGVPMGDATSPLVGNVLTKLSFYNNKDLTEVTYIDGENLENVQQMFSGCSNLQSIPLFSLGNATTMSGMFNKCTSLISIPAFDTSNITNMNAFTECTSLQSIPLLDARSAISAPTFTASYDYSNLNEMGGLANLGMAFTRSTMVNFLGLVGLSIESINNIADNLYDVTGTVAAGSSVRFAPVLQDYFDDGLTAKFTEKGWNIRFN